MHKCINDHEKLFFETLFTKLDQFLYSLSFISLLYIIYTLVRHNAWYTYYLWLFDFTWFNQNVALVQWYSDFFFVTVHFNKPL